MTLDVATVKRRRAVMMAVNVCAVLAALAALVGYFKFALGWALIVFVAALLVGFGAQIWFIAGLRGRESSLQKSARSRRAEGGA